MTHAPSSESLGCGCLLALGVAALGFLVGLAVASLWFLLRVSAV